MNVLFLVVLVIVSLLITVFFAFGISVLVFYGSWIAAKWRWHWHEHDNLALEPWIEGVFWSGLSFLFAIVLYFGWWRVFEEPPVCAAILSLLLISGGIGGICFGRWNVREIVKSLRPQF